MRAVRRVALLALTALLLAGWKTQIYRSANLKSIDLEPASSHTAIQLVPRTEVRGTQLFSFTHTTQADWMSGERNHLDVRALDALGTPYGFDQDPRGVMRLRSQPGPWSKHPESPVVVPGGEGSWDDAVISEAKVLYDGQVYHVWYAGRRRGPPGLKMPMDLGYATSTDGVHWTKPREGAVLERGPLGSYDENMITAPAVLYDGAQFHMWFSAVDFGGDWSINYASSVDGIRWNKSPENPVLVETHDDRWDAVYIAEPCVLYNGSYFEMWYNGASATTETLVGYATSPDGVQWTRFEGNRPVFDVALDGAWDDFAVARVHVMYDGELYKMWYEGHNGSTWRIGYATSTDGTAWERAPDNPIVDLGPDGAWDSQVASEPFALFDGRTYWLFHSGYDGDRYRAGLVTAPAMYETQGTFVSPPIESAHPVAWGTLHCDLSLPIGTEVRFEVAASDDGQAWGDWIDAGTLHATLPFSGVQSLDLYALDLSASRFLRYRAMLASTDPAVSPQIREISVAEASPDFAIALPQAAISLRPGDLTEIEVLVEGRQGFAAPIYLGIVDLPADLSATWSPGIITPPGVTTLYLEAGASVRQGTIPVTIAATSGDLAHQAVLSISLLEPLPSATATPTPSPTATPTALPARGPTPTPVPPPPEPQVETRSLRLGISIAAAGGAILLLWIAALVLKRAIGARQAAQPRARWWQHWGWAVLMALVIVAGVYLVRQHTINERQVMTEYETVVAGWPAGKNVPPDWLTESQIRQAIQARIVAQYRRPIAVQYLDRTVVLDVADLGFQSNAENLVTQAIRASETESGQAALETFLQGGSHPGDRFAFSYTIDDQKLRVWAQDIANEIERSPIEGAIDEGGLTFSASQTGVALNVGQAFERLKSAIADPSVTQVTLPVTAVEPRPLTDDEIALTLSRTAADWTEPPQPATMQPITIPFNAERWLVGDSKPEDWTPTRPMTGYVFSPGSLGWSLDITAAHRVIREATDTGAQNVSFKVITDVAPLPLTLDDIVPALLEIAAHFDGLTGLYVQDLETGAEIRHNTYLTTSGMSMIKVAIMATAYRGITRPFSAELQDAMFEMVAHSINEKSNYVILQIGEGDFQAGLARVNETLQALGMYQTYIASGYRTEKGPVYAPIEVPDRPAVEISAQERIDLWPDTAMQTSLSDQAIIFEALYRGVQGTGPLLAAFPHLTPEDCQEMLDLLKTNPVRTLLGPGFADDVPMAHKNGFGGGQYTDERMDVGIIWPPGGRPYLVGLYQWDKNPWIHWLRVWPQQIELSTTTYDYFTMPPTRPAPTKPR